MAVDLESYVMALDFEQDGILARIREERATSDWTSGYRFWVNYGTLALSPMQASEHDSHLRRAAWRARHQLHGESGSLMAQAAPEQ